MKINLYKVAEIQTLILKNQIKIKKIDIIIYRIITTLILKTTP